MKNQKYIIRCDRAGVFYGEIAKRQGDEAELRNARRIYYWENAATLSQLSQEGLGRNSKVSMSVPTITVLGVIEVIPVSEKAREIIEEQPDWRV